MKNITFSDKKFFENSTEETCITILGKDFRFQDKRGFGLHAEITPDFARMIISEFPAKVLHQERAEKMLLSGQQIKLSWSLYKGDMVDLRIHYASEHVFTSEMITL